MAETVKGNFFFFFCLLEKVKKKFPLFSSLSSSHISKNNETIQSGFHAVNHETIFEHIISFCPVVINEKMGFDKA